MIPANFNRLHTYAFKEQQKPCWSARRFRGRLKGSHILGEEIAPPIHQTQISWRKTCLKPTLPGLPIFLLGMDGTTKVLQNGNNAHFHVANIVYAEVHGRSESSNDACALFNKMHHQDVSVWNTVMTAWTRQGHYQVTLNLFDQMQQEAVVPDKVTFICILSACAYQVNLTVAKQMHARILANKFWSDLVIATALLNMYGKCSSLKDSMKVFEEMQGHDVVTWNAMIKVFVEHGYEKDALKLFSQMREQGVIPNKVTFISILASCTNHAAIRKGEELHAFILESECEADVVVGNALVSMYGQCGSIEDAQRMFDKIPQRDVVSWNAIISVYANHGQYKKALLHFYQMELEGLLPSKITFVSILGACTSRSFLAEGEQIHVQIMNNGYGSDVAVGNALVSMYCKCGSMEKVLEVFKRMPRHDVVSFSCVIAAYVQQGQHNQATNVFKQMLQREIPPNEVTIVTMLGACASPVSLAKGEQIHDHILVYGLDSNVVVGNALISMYGKTGSLKDAKSLFDKILKRDVVSWNAIIVACTKNEEPRKALELFHRMQHEAEIPDENTFVSIFDAFASHAELAEGKRMHIRILVSRLEVDVSVGNALVKMYGKCGKLEDSWKLFDKIHQQDIVSWNEMIAMFSHYGEGKRVLKVFEQMKLQGILPDEITIASIFSACASHGMLAEGKRMHACIKDQGFVSDVVMGTALVNMYGKCGSPDDAWKMFNKIAGRSTISWNAMIGVHAHHGQGKEALALFDHMQEEGVIPDNATFVSILTACSHAGLISEGCHFFVFMNRKHYTLPDVNHYVCMTDLLGRAGQLDEAEGFVNEMPVQPTRASFMALLGSSQYHFDLNRGEHAAKHVLKFDSDNVASHSSLMGFKRTIIIPYE